MHHLLCLQGGTAHPRMHVGMPTAWAAPCTHMMHKQVCWACAKHIHMSPSHGAECHLHSTSST